MGSWEITALRSRATIAPSFSTLHSVTRTLMKKKKMLLKDLISSVMVHLLHKYSNKHIQISAFSNIARSIFPGMKEVSQE